VSGTAVSGTEGASVASGTDESPAVGPATGSCSPLRSPSCGNDGSRASTWSDATIRRARSGSRVDKGAKHDIDCAGASETPRAMASTMHPAEADSGPDVSAMTPFPRAVASVDDAKLVSSANAIGSVPIAAARSARRINRLMASTLWRLTSPDSGAGTGCPGFAPAAGASRSAAPIATPTIAPARTPRRAHTRPPVDVVVPTLFTQSPFSFHARPQARSCSA
jgi:hypothetical protein